MKKSVLLGIFTLLLVTILTISACGKKPTQEAPKAEDQKIKVALLLPGPVNDMGWNASAYEGLVKSEEEHGIEISYTESVSQSDMEEYFRGYALKGYNIVIGHGFQFGDAAKAVAKDFPNTMFIVTSSNISQAPNLGSVNLANKQQGFIMGVVAGLMTKTNIVGGLGGLDIPPISLSIKGFKEGAEFVNPNVKVLTTLTGSNEDVAKMKETALAMINEGADIVMANANQAGLGAIQAAKEKGVLAIGSNQDQNSIAPDTVLVSGIKSNPNLISFVVEKYKKGELEAKFYELGVKEGAVYLSSWHGFESKVPKEVKDKLEQVLNDIKNGTIKISDY
ncbi:MAG: BMP family protein [Bacillota bacterium]